MSKTPRSYTTYRGYRRNLCRAEEGIWALGEYYYRGFNRAAMKVLSSIRRRWNSRTGKAYSAGAR